jgi:GGDEF domain-containing protein
VNRAHTTAPQNGQPVAKVGLDDATGVWNRAGFISAATPMFLSCQRRAVPVTLGYFDIRSARETHPVADGAVLGRVLSAVAKQMGKTFRDCDIIGRIDTFRFAVLFADCTDEALRAMEGVRAVADESDPPIEHTLSIAIVESSPGATLDDLMRELDRRANTLQRGEQGDSRYNEFISYPVPAKPAKRRTRSGR